MGALRHLRVEVREGVACVALNRPERRNAIDAALALELAEVFERLGQERTLRCAVLAGVGPAFCAGADLRWLAPQESVPEAEALQDAQRLVRMFRAVDECPCPVIGRLHGAIFGGGVGLVACCDIAVAAADARFALSEARLGMVPAIITPFLLRTAGESFTRRYSLTGETFDAGVAQRYHLVHDVVPLEQLDEQVDEVVDAILQLAPGAVRETKRLLYRLSAMAQGDHWSACSQVNVEARLSEEAREGMQAFLAKRRPHWSPKA